MTFIFRSSNRNNNNDDELVNAPPLRNAVAAAAAAHHSEVLADSFAAMGLSTLDDKSQPPSLPQTPQGSSNSSSATTPAARHASLTGSKVPLVMPALPSSSNVGNTLNAAAVASSASTASTSSSSSATTLPPLTPTAPAAEAKNTSNAPNVVAGAVALAPGHEIVNGFRVHAAKYREVVEKKKNLSPFDAKKYYPLLPPPVKEHAHRVLLILDIDETLVHASYTPGKRHDLRLSLRGTAAAAAAASSVVASVGSTGATTAAAAPPSDIYVALRPHLHHFLREVAQMFEVAIFTASQSCYADQLMDAIDPHRRMLGHNRLFREHCADAGGSKVKDLSLLGRPLHRVALVDNSPVTYLFQPRNAVPILSWFDDEKDTELLKLLPMLRQLAASESVYEVLDPWNSRVCQ